MTGISVCAGRLPPASTFGERSSSEKEEPRLWQMIPVCGSRISAPNVEKTLWISDTAYPSPSAATTATVSPVASGTSAAPRPGGPPPRAASASSSACAPDRSSSSGTSEQRGSARCRSRSAAVSAKSRARTPASFPWSSRPDAELVQGREDLEQHESLRVRRRRQHLEPAEAAGDRRRELCLVRRQVVERQLRAERPQPLEEACADLAAVERRRPLAGDRAQRAGERRLAQGGSLPTAARRPSRKTSRSPSSAASSPCSSSIPSGERAGDRHSLLGVDDRRLERVCEGAAAAEREQGLPGGHRSGHRHGGGARDGHLRRWIPRRSGAVAAEAAAPLPLTATATPSGVWTSATMSPPTAQLCG